MRNRSFPIAGILCGILSVIFAIVLLSGNPNLSEMSTGTRTSYSWYGGDAYTGMQQASADTARNVKDLAEIVLAGFRGLNGSGMGYLLLVLGLWMIIHSLHVLNEIKVRDQFEGKVLAALAHTPSPEPPVTAPPETNAAEISGAENGAADTSGSAGDAPKDEDEN